MACGCIVVCANDALRGSIPDALMPDDSIDSISRSIAYALSLPEHERFEIARRNRVYVEREHSLSHLVGKLTPVLRGASAVS